MKPAALWGELQEILELKSLNSAENLHTDVSGAYCGDLLSDVLARAEKGDIWVTIQKHLNVVAIAELVGMSGIIVTGNRVPEQEVINAAEDKKIPIFSTSLDTFLTAGRLYEFLKQKRFVS